MSADRGIPQIAMFGIHDFVLFITTGILLNLTPGPDTLYILGRSIAHGRRAGVASALGISVGSIFHTCAAALGLSAVLATSAWAFTFVKLAGAAYLIFLGVRALLDKQSEFSMPAHFKWRGATAAFRQGIVTQHFEPEGRAVFSRVPAAIHRCERAVENDRVHRARAHVRHDRHDLVPDSGVVLEHIQRPSPGKSNVDRVVKSRCGFALYFSWASTGGGCAEVGKL
jgi:hypothetical protein